MVSALRKNDEVRPARKHQSDQKPEDRVRVRCAGRYQAEEREETPRHEWKTRQIANRAGERAQTSNPRLGVIDVALENCDAVPIRSQHGGGRTPQLLTAAPPQISADEDKSHTLFSFHSRRSDRSHSRERVVGVQ